MRKRNNKYEGLIQDNAAQDSGTGEMTPETLSLGDDTQCQYTVSSHMG